MTNHTTNTMPAGETWTMTDDRMRDLRHEMQEAEDRLTELRRQMNTMITHRRGDLRRDDTVVCPVCGVVTNIHIGTVAPHESVRGGQCRGTGIGWAARFNETGGL